MNPLAYVELAIASLVVLWLATGLFANPLLFGSVALLVLLPLALVVLPALGVHAFGDRSVTVRLLPPVRNAEDPPQAESRAAFPTDD